MLMKTTTREVARTGTLRLTWAADDRGGMYLLYVGLDTLLWYGRSGAEAADRYDAALDAGEA
jgi:hypothetical protein